MLITNRMTRPKRQTLPCGSTIFRRRPGRELLQVYHVFIDRFNPGSGRTWNKPERLDGFFGGTIRGVEEKLSYIQGPGLQHNLAIAVL